MMKKWLGCLLLLVLFAIPCAGADYTRAFTGINPNSAQYDTHALYMDIDRNVVGCWAAIGAQDSMPYLIIREDGTMEEIGYDGENGSVQGKYAYDPQTGLFTFPDGQQWTLTLTLSDGEMPLSGSSIGDDPVPAGTRVLHFECEPQSDMNDGWMAYACVPYVPFTYDCAE